MVLNTHIYITPQIESKYTKNPTTEYGVMEPFIWFGQVYPEYTMMKNIVTYRDGYGDPTLKVIQIELFSLDGIKVDTFVLSLQEIRADIPIAFYIAFSAKSSNLLGAWAGALRINRQEVIMTQGKSGSVIKLDEITFNELIRRYGVISTYGGYGHLLPPVDVRFQSPAYADYNINIIPKQVKPDITIYAKGNFDPQNKILVYGQLAAVQHPMSDYNVSISIPGFPSLTTNATTNSEGNYSAEIILPEADSITINVEYAGDTPFYDAIYGFIKLNKANASKQIKTDSFFQNILQSIFGGKERTLSNPNEFKVISRRR